MPFTFQPSLQVLQQPDKHSYSLQLPTHTELAHHYIQYMLYQLFQVFVCLFVLVHIKALINGTHQSDSSLFIPVATKGKCKQINNSNLHDVISLIIYEKLNDFADAVLPTLNSSLIIIIAAAITDNGY